MCFVGSVLTVVFVSAKLVRRDFCPRLQPTKRVGVMKANLRRLSKLVTGICDFLPFEPECPASVGRTA